MGEKKRTVLTPAERAAKARAELADLEAKAEAADRKQLAKLTEQRDKLNEQITSRIEKRDAIQEEIDAIVERLPEEPAAMTEAEADEKSGGMTV